MTEKPVNEHGKSKQQEVVDGQEAVVVGQDGDTTLVRHRESFETAANGAAVAPDADVFDQLWHRFTSDNDAMSFVMHQAPVALVRHISPASTCQSPAK